MINVNRVINSPRLRQSFPVTRKTGAYSSDGNFHVTETALTMTGVITPMKSRDIMQLPQADILKGAIEIRCNAPLQTSHLDTDTEGSLSDVVTWQGEAYKVFSADDFMQYGYFYAIAIRTKGS